MPMIPQAIASMLACQRIGAIHSVVFGGFAPNELAIRINDVSPKVILCATPGVEPGPRYVNYKKLVDESLHLCNPSISQNIKVLVLHRKNVQQPPASMIRGRDFEWDEVMETKPFKECVPVEVWSLDYYSVNLVSSHFFKKQTTLSRMSPLMSCTRVVPLENRLYDQVYTIHTFDLFLFFFSLNFSPEKV